MIRTALIAVAGWFILFSILYVGYFSSWRTSAKGDPTIEDANAAARLVCQLITDADPRCWNRVTYWWRDPWRPPVWLWERGWVTPYLAAAPYYFLPVSQIILIAPEYWGTMSREERIELVAHELGHALFGWDHSANPESLMTTTGWHANWIAAFKVAYEENER